MTFTLEFTSLTSGPCATQGEWFEWETYPDFWAAEAALKVCKIRYPGYGWRSR